MSSVFLTSLATDSPTEYTWQILGAMTSYILPILNFGVGVGS